MELKRFLEVGRIVNTHGVNGGVRIEPWADSAQALAGLKRLFIDGEERRVVSASVHKGMALVRLEGVDDVNAAMCLKGRVVFADRADIPLADGEYFISDIIGLPVIDEASGRGIGVLREALEYPASMVYVVAGEEEHLIPAVPEFIKKVDLENGAVYVRLIEGM